MITDHLVLDETLEMYKMCDSKKCQQYYMGSHTHTRMHTCTHACTHTRARTHTHKHTHTHTHTHKHTYTVCNM